jgi:hypothetical protein
MLRADRQGKSVEIRRNNDVFSHEPKQSTVKIKGRATFEPKDQTKSKPRPHHIQPMLHQIKL